MTYVLIGLIALSIIIPVAIYAYYFLRKLADAFLAAITKLLEVWHC
ncbi:MAG: hypothetical protein HY398_01680 [Candidatus Doudnabacteria bacterium]|nr:hypothetical protein [Candidatus Doudnabacteria bacterium]